METPNLETMLNPTLSTTSAAAGNRSASPPMGGGIRDGSFGAIFGMLAVQAGSMACGYFGATPEMAAQCGQIAGWAGTIVTGVATGLLMGGFTAIRKWRADREVKHRPA